MPLAVLYIPTYELIRHGGRLTESGMILVSRPIPFKFVRDVWFCVPDPDHLYKFATIQKILGYDLEDGPIANLTQFQRRTDSSEGHEHSIRVASRTT